MLKKPSIILISTLFYHTVTWASPTQLTYDYSVPYAGGATLTVYNNGDTPVKVDTIEITNNSEISGNPWGSLFGWQSTITNKENADKTHIIHTIKENPIVTIPAKQSAVLSYGVGNIKGVLQPNHAAMDPNQVVINGATIDIKGMCVGDACKDPGNGKRVLGYLPNWAYWRSPKFTANNVSYSKLNMVAYAFAIFDRDGKVSLYDQDADAYNLPILSQKRKQNPYLDLSLSFGGWGWFSTPQGWSCPKGDSPNGPAACFQQMASDTKTMQKFVKNAVSAMKEINFNGLDIDWEYPEAKDATHFVDLLKALRAELDAQGKKDNTYYHLSIASGAGIDKIQNLTKTEWQTIASLVDHIGVMTYDFHGAWDQGQVGSNFMSAMQLDPINDPTYQSAVLGKYNLTDGLNAYLERGVPAEKLIVGIPMYGRMVNIAGSGDKQGLYQTINGTPQGEFDNQMSGHTGMLNYNCIVDKTTCSNNYTLPALTLVNPTQSKWGAYSLTPWGFSDNLFVTFDDAKSAAYKANWVKQQHFAGVMVWDLTGDFEGNDSRSILNAIYHTFN